MHLNPKQTLKIEDLKKCLSEKSLNQCREIQDYSPTPETIKQTLKEESWIPDAEPTDVATGYNGKQESFLNIHTTDKLN